MVKAAGAFLRSYNHTLTCYDRAVKLFRLFGVPVVAHWSFLILLFLIVSAFGPIVTAALVVSMLAHEFGHVLVARHFGQYTSHVMMFALGMAAFLREIPRRGEAWMAVAGPMVNFVIAAIIFGVMSVFVFPTAVVETLTTIVLLNMILGLFNLVPIYPLDGGRIVRGILSRFTTRFKATKIAAIVGSIGVIGLIPYALSTGNFILIAILGLVVFMSWKEVKILKAGGPEGSEMY